MSFSSSSYTSHVSSVWDFLSIYLSHFLTTSRSNIFRMDCVEHTQNTAQRREWFSSCESSVRVFFSFIRHTNEFQEWRIEEKRKKIDRKTIIRNLEYKYYSEMRKWELKRVCYGTQEWNFGQTRRKSLLHRVQVQLFPLHERNLMENFPASRTHFIPR